MADMDEISKPNSAPPMTDTAVMAYRFPTTNMMTIKPKPGENGGKRERKLQQTEKGTRKNLPA